MTVCLLQLAVCPLEAAVCWLEALSRLLMGSAVEMYKGPEEMVSTGSEAMLTTGLRMSTVLVVMPKVSWLTVSTLSTHVFAVLEGCSATAEDGSTAKVEVELWLKVFIRVEGLSMLPVLRYALSTLAVRSTVGLPVSRATLSTELTVVLTMGVRVSKFVS